MLDYSKYHPSFEDKVINDGQKMFELAKKGINGYFVNIDNNLINVVIEDKYYNPDGDLKYIMADLGILKLGSIVNFQNNNWIIVELTKDNPIYQTAVMQLCNATLKWKPTFSSSPLEYPCVAKSKFQFMTLDQQKYITLPDGTIQVIVQLNVDTKTIVLGQRFIFGSNVYSVTGIDDFGKQGLLVLSMKLAQKNDLDDFVNILADNSHLFSASGGTDGGGWL